MIYEYAIDPQLIHNWAQNKRDRREFVQSFGIGQPRIMAGFPKFHKWRSLVLRSIPASFTDNDKKIVEELVNAIGEVTVRRNRNIYDGSTDWLDNIRTENAATPFNNVFLKSRPTPPLGNEFEQADIYSKPTKYWDFPSQVLANRTASELADAVSNMLRLATRIIFIDPYIRNTSDKLNPLAAYINRAINNRVSDTSPDIEVIFDGNSSGAPTSEYLYNAIISNIGDSINHVSLTVKELGQNIGGEKLHNRYILTDLGGCSFGVGLDEGSGSESDEITLLSKEVYDLRWRQYVKGNEFNQISLFP